MAGPDYCCPQFHGAYHSATETGLSIALRDKDRLGPYFVVRFAAVADEDVSRLPETDVRIRLSGEQAIKYCPWCGSLLCERYPDPFNLDR